MFTDNDWSNPKWAGPNSAGAGVPHLHEQGNATVHTGPSAAGGGKPAAAVAEEAEESTPDVPVILTQATLTTATGVPNAELKYTAVTPGAVGNGITVRYVNPEAPGALAVGVSGQAITVTLGYAEATVASGSSTQGPDINANIAFYAVVPGTGGNAITIALVDPVTSQSTLSISALENEITVSLATGDNGEIISTANEVVAEWAQVPAASALCSVTSPGDGTGIVVAELVALGGGTEAATSSNAYHVMTAIEEDAAASALVTVEYAPGNNGGGMLVAMDAIALTGGG